MFEDQLKTTLAARELAILSAKTSNEITTAHEDAMD